MAIAGKGGSVKLTANTVADVTSWTVDIAIDMLDSTSLGDDWREYVAGLAGATGSVECNWAVATDTNGQTALQTAALAGSTVTLNLYTNDSNYYSGSAYVSNVNVADPVDDLVTATFDFQYTGTVSYN
jgi:predicted secreted protein